MTNTNTNNNNNNNKSTRLLTPFPLSLLPPPAAAASSGPAPSSVTGNADKGKGKESMIPATKAKERATAAPPSLDPPQSFVVTSGKYMGSVLDYITFKTLMPLLEGSHVKIHGDGMAAEKYAEKNFKKDKDGNILRLVKAMPPLASGIKSDPIDVKSNFPTPVRPDGIGSPPASPSPSSQALNASSSIVPLQKRVPLPARTKIYRRLVPTIEVETDSGETADTSQSDEDFFATAQPAKNVAKPKQKLLVPTSTRATTSNAQAAIAPAAPAKASAKASGKAPAKAPPIAPVAPKTASASVTKFTPRTVLKRGPNFAAALTAVLPANAPDYVLPEGRTFVLPDSSSDADSHTSTLPATERSKRRYYHLLVETRDPSSVDNFIDATNAASRSAAEKYPGLAEAIEEAFENTDDAVDVYYRKFPLSHLGSYPKSRANSAPPATPTDRSQDGQSPPKKAKISATWTPSAAASIPVTSTPTASTSAVAGPSNAVAGPSTFAPDSLDVSPSALSDIPSTYYGSEIDDVTLDAITLFLINPSK